MRFVNTGRVATVRRNSATESWEVWSLTSRAWLPAPVSNDADWNDVQGYYKGLGSRVRYSTVEPVSLAV